MIITMNIIIWDNDGTVQGARTPNDPNKMILPNVEKTMRAPHTFNVICSGCKTEESEKQNFDPKKVIKNMKSLMQKLPINIVTFSPAIGGVECYVLIKKEEEITVYKAHEDNRYKRFIGQFKKPDVGMFYVIKDVLHEEFNLDISSATMIGDTWHDQHAAKAFGIDFKPAKEIHACLK